MGGRLPWRRLEDDVLLRAWAQIGAADVPPSQAQDALLKRYKALCPHVNIRFHRPVKALFARKCTLERMHELICAFRDRPHAVGAGDRSGVGLKANSAFKYPSDDWFELAIWEQQRWLMALGASSSSGAFVDLRKYQFNEIDAIAKAANGGERPRRYAQTVQMASASSGDVTATAGKLTEEYVRSMITRFARENYVRALPLDQSATQIIANSSSSYIAATMTTSANRGEIITSTGNPLVISARPLARRDDRETIETADATTSARTEGDDDDENPSWWEEEEIVPRSPETAAAAAISSRRPDDLHEASACGGGGDVWHPGDISTQQEPVDAWRAQANDHSSQNDLRQRRDGGEDSVIAASRMSLTSWRRNPRPSVPSFYGNYGNERAPRKTKQRFREH